MCDSRHFLSELSLLCSTVIGYFENMRKKIVCSWYRENTEYVVGIYIPVSECFTLTRLARSILVEYEQLTFTLTLNSPPLCADLRKGMLNGGMSHFQEIMRQQLESSIHSEMEKLLGTTAGAEREVTSPLRGPTFFHSHRASGCDLEGGGGCRENTRVTHTVLRCK